MKRRADPAMRAIPWVVAAAVVCVVVAALLRGVLPPDAPTGAADLLDIPDENFRLYARAQRETGVPWVVVCAADGAHAAVVDWPRVQAVADAFIRAGAAQRGLFADPFDNAAELAGLYATTRKNVARIARRLLALERAQRLIDAGRFPADGGRVVEQAQGWRIEGGERALSPFEGVIEAVEGEALCIRCDNGYTVRFDGIDAPDVSAGGRVGAGESVGRSGAFFLALDYQGRRVDPYPLLLLWAGEGTTFDVLDEPPP
jgi:hypothetical protein